MRKTAFLLVLTLLVPLGLALTGCGDSNLFKSISTGSSDDAKMEEAVEALDNQQWNKAIALLGDVSDSDSKRKYLASAYLGLAGFDTLELIALIDEAEEANEGGGDMQSVLWSAAGALFEDDEVEDGLLTSEIVAEKLEDLNNALSVLFTGEIGNDWYSLLEGTPARVGATEAGDVLSELSDNRLFQAGLASALHTMLKVSSLLHVDESNVVIDPLTYTANFQTELPSIEELPEGFMDQVVDDLSILAASLDRMSDSSDNSLLEDLNQFLIDIGYADDGVVSQEELNTFLQNVSSQGGTQI